MLSWITVLPGTPQVYAPCNALVVFPIFLLGDAVPRGAAFGIGFAVVPLLFCLWCWPALRGSTRLPIRSVILLLIAIALSALWLAGGYHYGVQYQSVGYVVGVAMINSICWVVLIALALLAHRHPSFGHNLGFHFALFAWLAWFAFPYLGELP